MPGKIPVSVLKFGNKHKRSKQYLKDREESEIKIGDGKFQLPQTVKRDPEAHKKWKQLVKLYEDLDYVTSADSDILAQYCLCHSEHEHLLKSKKEELERLKKIKASALDVINFLNTTNIDNMINKKRDALQKLAGKIFLDPTSRIKGVPTKKTEPEQTPLETAGFGNI